MKKRHLIGLIGGLVLVAGTIVGATQSAAIPLFNSRGTVEPSRSTTTAWASR